MGKIQPRRNQRQLREIKTSVAPLPLEQLIAVKSENPVARGIEVAGQVLGQAIQRRNQLRNQQEQSDLLAKAFESGDLTGLSPENQIDLMKIRGKEQNPYLVPGNSPVFDMRTGQYIYPTSGGPATGTPKPLAPVKQDVKRESTMDKEIAKLRVDIAKSRPETNSAVSELERIKELNKNSFSGPVGSKAFSFARATGVGAKSEIFKNTSDVANTLKGLVAKTLKSTFAGQLSDGERNYLNEVYGGADGMAKEERAIAIKNVQNMLREKFRGKESALNELTGKTQPNDSPQDGGVVTREMAINLLKEAGGDKERAKALARSRNMRF